MGMTYKKLRLLKSHGIEVKQDRGEWFVLVDRCGLPARRAQLGASYWIGNRWYNVGQFIENIADWATCGIGFGN